MAKSIISPFENLDISKLEHSHDLDMLKTIVDILPYKLSCYKFIVDSLYENKGLECNELAINVFNSDIGLDSISIIKCILNKGFNIQHIKEVRLFEKDKESLKRSLLLHKKIFPNIKFIPFLLDQ